MNTGNTNVKPEAHVELLNHPISVYSNNNNNNSSCFSTLGYPFYSYPSYNNPGYSSYGYSNTNSAEPYRFGNTTTTTPFSSNGKDQYPFNSSRYANGVCTAANTGFASATTSPNHPVFSSATGFQSGCYSAHPSLVSGSLSSGFEPSVFNSTSVSFDDSAYNTFSDNTPQSNQSTGASPLSNSIVSNYALAAGCQSESSISSSNNNSQQSPSYQSTDALCSATKAISKAESTPITMSKKRKRSNAANQSNNDQYAPINHERHNSTQTNGAVIEPIETEVRDISKRPKILKLNMVVPLADVNSNGTSLLDNLNSATGEYACSYCLSMFASAAKLLMHQHKHHKNGSSTQCPVCFKRFGNQANTLVHLRAHTQEKTYKCNQCDNAFCDSSTLKKHLRTHTGEKPYECSLCFKKFTQSGNLKRHLSVHEKYEQELKAEEAEAASIAAFSSAAAAPPPPSAMTIASTSLNSNYLSSAHSVHSYTSAANQLPINPTENSFQSQLSHVTSTAANTMDGTNSATSNAGLFNYDSCSSSNNFDYNASYSPSFSYQLPNNCYNYY